MCTHIQNLYTHGLLFYHAFLGLHMYICVYALSIPSCISRHIYIYIWNLNVFVYSVMSFKAHVYIHMEFVCIECVLICRICIHMGYYLIMYFWNCICMYVCTHCLFRDVFRATYIYIYIYMEFVCIECVLIYRICIHMNCYSIMYFWDYVCI